MIIRLGYVAISKALDITSSGTITYTNYLKEENKNEKLGYLKREASDKDSRSTNIVLTQKGEDFKATFDQISNNLNKMLNKNLSENEVKLLEELLRKV